MMLKVAALLAHTHTAGDRGQIWVSSCRTVKASYVWNQINNARVDLCLRCK